MTSFNTWNSPASGTLNSEATAAVGCQNSMTTTYVHHVTTNDDNVMFMCEVGTNSQCGFGAYSSNITIRLGNYHRNVISLLVITTKSIFILDLNNPEFENYLGQMYTVELEIKDMTESNTSASYLDLLLSIGRDGQLHTSICDKRDDFNFHITNFPFLSSNIPTSPAYGFFNSQLIRYARACSSYGCLILRATQLSNKLLEQEYIMERLKLSLRKFYGRYGDLIKQYEVSLSQMLKDICDLTIYNDNPLLIRRFTELDLLPIV